MATSSTRQLFSNFRESRFTSYSHELKVFIYGADVTPWLKGDLSITYGSRDSFNSCVFEISNPRKIWQLTKPNLSVGTDENVEGHFRLSVGEYSEKEKYFVYRWKNTTYINPYFNLMVDATYLGGKDSEQTAAGQPGKAARLLTHESSERRYRFAVGDCIFNRQDPLRVFMRNPYSSVGNQWVEIFCGFVHDAAITTNHMTGDSTVRVAGYCIRQLLTRMRVQLKFCLDDTKINPEPLFSDGFFTDFMKPSIGSHPFQGAPLEQTIKELILGTATPEVGKLPKSVSGIGEFKLGNVVCYDPNTPADTLEKWHLLTMFGVNKVANPSANDDLWLTTDEMNKIGRATLYLPETYGQSPAGRYLHFLLPHGGTGAGNLLSSSAVADSGIQLEWTNRWEIIKDFASKLDFQVLTSPSGDILVEFPMFGFTPHMFVDTGVSADKYQYYSPFVSSDAGKQQAVEDEYDRHQASLNVIDKQIESGLPPLSIGSLFTFDLHQIEETINDEAEELDTVIQVDGGLTPMEETTISSELPLRAYVWSTVLVSRYGAITGQLNIPFSGQRSGEESERDHEVRLARLGMIEYMKRMANASTLDGSVVYRPFLFPNRPIWMKKSSRMGVATSITQKWTIGKSASTNVSLNMLMAERYEWSTTDADKHIVSWRLPTGAVNSPIDYANVWGKDAKNATNSGVFVRVGSSATDKKTSSQGQPAGSKEAAESSTQKQTQNSGQFALTDKDHMYQPFANAIQDAINKAQAAGMKIAVTSTFRDPVYQQWLKDNPKARAKTSSGQPVQVAEPWKSAHQYGMAVDISINGSRDYSLYQKFFMEHCDRNIIYWGGTYNDHVHFEWKVPGTGGGDTSRRANRFRLASPNANDDNKYLTEVWKQFDALGMTPEEVTRTAATPREKTAIGTETTPAPECSPKVLPEAGYNTIKTVADTIIATAFK